MVSNLVALVLHFQDNNWVILHHFSFTRVRLVDAFMDHLCWLREQYIERHWAGTQFEQANQQLLKETKETYNTEKKS